MNTISKLTWRKKRTKLKFHGIIWTFLAMRLDWRPVDEYIQPIFICKSVIMLKMNKKLIKIGKMIWQMIVSQIRLNNFRKSEYYSHFYDFSSLRRPYRNRASRKFQKSKISWNCDFIQIMQTSISELIFQVSLLCHFLALKCQNFDTRFGHLDFLDTLRIS